MSGRRPEGREAKIVDAHVHLLPERLAAKIRRFFTDRGAPPMPYPHAPEQARRALEAAGIARCWSLPYAHRPGVAAGLNRWMAKTFAADRFVVPGATVHPGDDVETVVREAVEELHLSIFKLHCSVGSFGPDDPRLEPLWRRSSDEGWPTTVHAGSAATGAATDLEIAAVGRVAVRFPRARIIVAHCGAPAIRAALELLRRHEHIYADLCPVVADPAPLKRRDIAGVERKILFGSDTPSVAVRIEESIARVKAWGLDAAQEAAILGGNARALLDRRETMAPRKDDSEPGSSGE